MAEQHLQPPSATTGQAAGCQCCSHEQCARPKDLGYSRWRFARWENPRFTMPSQVLTELQTRFGQRGFAFAAIHTFDGRKTVVEILLRLHSDEETVLCGSIFDQPYHFSDGLIDIWSLTCCRYILKYDTKVWAETFRQKEGAILFGDPSLPGALRDEMNRVLGDPQDAEWPSA